MRRERFIKIIIFKIVNDFARGEESGSRLIPVLIWVGYQAVLYKVLVASTYFLYLSAGYRASLPAPV